MATASWIAPPKRMIERDIMSIVYAPRGAGVAASRADSFLVLFKRRPQRREAPEATMKKTALLAQAMLAVLVATACGAQKKPGTPDSPARQTGSAAANQLTEAERAAGWRQLFDGKTTTGWRGYKSAAMPGGWDVADGNPHKTAGLDD